MQLTEDEIVNFYNIYKSLLVYVNKKKSIILKIVPEGFLFENAQKVRDYLIKNMSIIDQYVTENPDHLSKEELKIVSSFKYGIYGNFFIVKHDKEYTYIFDPENKKSYGIDPLDGELEDLVLDGYSGPVLVNMFLLPFKKKIIFDGILLYKNIYFGKNYERELKAKYEEAILKYGLITSFDYSKSREVSEEELLRFYLKNDTNRDMFFDNVMEILEKNPSLGYILYSDESKRHSRKIKSSLKKNGARGYFAVLFDSVVASASNKNDLEGRISEVLQNNKRDWIYIFKI
ncbi:MAG: hypothetical protein APG12_00490 [Candidatus Methanofastidiosum methylothiophilum]|uniref:Uncharacterized protein n=1 Tax=Candidatus Methanofastidiosum methylothiophilum TaxID=1705564 RepID=A0A150ITI3_9EURY|nr:MAG: hypothetical protein APG10_00355 [Candidatus Methanofastidiosum methylthiophilus]KYC48270.1 MAG: hypothetical protein APG11_00509 [Candidatus Methanofastidiosum methylthiophilus]KYC50927.1 MAG: hypothetical protein APG12_00490 [Candidatus Methanofastidiosum methylthiophilus]